MNALIVDRSRLMRQMHRQVLMQMGFTSIVEARDGLDAVQVLSDFEPELILTSWHLLGLDGCALIRHVREGGHSTPIVMVTSESDDGRREQAFDAGATAYVAKPFTPDLLRQRIEEALSIRSV